MIEPHDRRMVLERVRKAVDTGTSQKKAQIIEVCNQEEQRSLVPSQIVPRLDLRNIHCLGTDSEEGRK
jgi:hypothetical protein